MSTGTNIQPLWKLILPAIAALALGSCQTATTEASSAIICDKCASVWIQQPVYQGPSLRKRGYFVLQSTKSMLCPDCESLVATFFKTGQLKHRCSRCGGTMSHCVRH